jgi:transcriptional regulator with XRE-family HTH domain
MRLKSIPNDTEKRLKYLAILFKEFRLIEGLTQEQLCNKTSLSRSTLVRVEKAKGFNINTVFLLADALDIRLSDIFADLD